MSDPAYDNVNLLREASPYIYRHRDKTFVIAFPGEVIEAANFRRLIQDIAIISALGSRIVIVHGTRSQINQRLADKGKTSQFHNNIRITAQDDLPAVTEAIGCLRIKIENLLSSALTQPNLPSHKMGVSSGNYLTARPLGILEGIDYKHTGQIRQIAQRAIETQLANNIVLVSPIGYSPSGEIYNLDYEHVALNVSKALNADKILFISDHDNALPHALTAQDITADSDSSSFLKRLSQYLLSGDIERAHLLSNQVDGALLLELYTRDGIGSLIATEQFEQIRAANIEDISHILELIRPLEQAGTLIKRSREQLELEIGNFHVLSRDQQIIGCVALYPHSKEHITELACLAIHPHYRGNQRGNKLLQYSIQHAQQLGQKQLLVLTTQTTDWFRERAFKEGSIDDLPRDKKALYNYQRNSKVLIRTL